MAKIPHVGPFQLHQAIKFTKTKEQGSMVLLPVISIYHMRQEQCFCKQGKDLVSFAGVFQGLFWAHIPGQDHDCQQGQSRSMLQGAVLSIWLAAGYGYQI